MESSFPDHPAFLSLHYGQYGTRFKDPRSNSIIDLPRLDGPKVLFTAIPCLRNSKNRLNLRFRFVPRNLYYPFLPFVTRCFRLSNQLATIVGLVKKIRAHPIGLTGSARRLAATVDGHAGIGRNISRKSRKKEIKVNFPRSSQGNSRRRSRKSRAASLPAWSGRKKRSSGTGTASV